MTLSFQIFPMSLLLRLLKPLIKKIAQSQARKNLADYNQNLTASSLKDKVRIVRDEWAVPHIYAQNQDDLFFAQGYIHAQDRLWQMELTRRVFQGRLSEIIGKDALEVDIICRKLGLKLLGETDQKELKEHELFTVVERYVAGINFYLETLDHIPVEFKLLKFKPETWAISDCFAMARLLSLQMSQGFLHQIERWLMTEKYGMAKAQEIFPVYPPQNPTGLSMGIETNQRINAQLKAFQGPYLPSIGGSNNWTVAANKMENAAAALCNDPHLLIGTPNIWYENHLKAPDFEVTGVSIPGVPLVMIGHNRKIAWGATLSYADIQDCFIEKFTGPSCLQYHCGDRILKSSKREERIDIKGQATHVFDTIHTHHGPVIMDIDDHTKISLASKALQQNDMMFGFYNLNRADNWDDFVGACAQLSIPSLSLVYADTSHNIGYYMTGEVPLRNQRKGLLPNLGFDGKQEWNGRVPFEQMPHRLNPKQGYFYTCNHRIVDDSYPHDLGNIWMNGYRAKRLANLFESKKRYNFNDFAQWQLDFLCQPGLDFAQVLEPFKSTPEFESLPKRTQQTVDLLTTWDGLLTADCVGGTVYQVLKQQLLDLIFGEKRSASGKVTTKAIPIFEITEFFGHDSTTLLRLLQNKQSLWWQGTSIEVCLQQACQATEHYLSQNLGVDMNKWTWGSLHRMTAKHALGVKKPVDAIFDVGDQPIGGDTDTLCQIAFIPGKHYGGTMVGASYRQMINLGDFDKSVCIAPVGQSGNFVSAHYQDQFDRWVKGKYKPMIWSDEQVQRHKKYESLMQPDLDVVD